MLKVFVDDLDHENLMQRKFYTWNILILKFLDLWYIYFEHHFLVVASAN